MGTVKDALKRGKEVTITEETATKSGRTHGIVNFCSEPTMTIPRCISLTAVISFAIFAVACSHEDELLLVNDYKQAVVVDIDDHYVRSGVIPVHGSDLHRFVMGDRLDFVVLSQQGRVLNKFSASKQSLSYNIFSNRYAISLRATNKTVL